LLILISFFMASLFITALSTSLVMGMLQRRILENVTFDHRAKRQAEERWRFMRKAAHNLRAPLAAVMSMIEVLKEDYLGPLSSSQREHLRRVYRRTRSMAAMIEKLMTIARSRTGVRPASPKPMTLSEMAGRVTRTFEDRARQKRLGFSIAVPDELSQTTADLEVVEPVLENLISNAIKYTQSGEVTVSFSITDQFLTLEVKDTGIGIPESDKAHLFEEFFRARNAKSVEEVGTGLGLALVKETVTQQGGTLEWESLEGVGTQFTVYLPLFAPSDDAQ
jgi:signal transduction histidine kinase